MNKKIILFSLIFFQHIPNLNAATLTTKYRIVEEYLKPIELATVICDEKGYLAQLNNKSPKISSRDGSWMEIRNPYLYEFIRKNENHDPDIAEFKRLKKAFKHRSNKYKSTINFPWEKLIESRKKLLEDAFTCNEIECINFRKIYDEKILEDINSQLDQEGKQLFEEGSQLLDKICEKYPDKINKFKQMHEKNITILHNELQYQQHEKTTNLVDELTTHQYQ
jgi:hypothetical protein